MATTRPLVIAAIAVRDRKVSDGAVKKSMHDNTSENTRTPAHPRQHQRYKNQMVGNTLRSIHG